MKRISAAIIIGFLCFSMFSMFAPHGFSSVSVIDETQLTTSPYGDHVPAWSSDGQRIAYMAFDSGGWYRHIWIMSKDGTNKQQLTFGGVVDGNPSFSPDDSKIYFARWGLRGDYTDLMVMSVDGTGITRLTYGPNGVMYSRPVVSSDGTKILFGMNYGTSAGPYDFWFGVMDSNKIVYSLADVQVFKRGCDAVWTSNDQRILYSTRYNFNTAGYIMIMDKDGTNDQQLTSGPIDCYPSMSPDNAKIVFSRATDPSVTDSEIYTANVDGSNPEPLTLDNMMSAEPFFNPRSEEGYYEIVYTSYRRSGNPDIWSLCFAMPLIPATIDVDPDTLNLRSKGNWITGYVELPEGHSVAGINVSTIMLNGTIPVDPSAPKTIGDYDNDGVRDLMVKFDRAQVIQYILDHTPIEGRFSTGTLTMTGSLNDGVPFEGSDTIRIVLPNPQGLGKRAIPQ